MSVYFITARAIGLVKIGCARNPKKRIASLRTSCPSKLVLEATLPGYSKEEGKIHKRFAQYRTHGEWFNLSEEIEAFIRDTGFSFEFDGEDASLKPVGTSDEKLVEESIARSNEMLAEALRDFASLGPVSSITPLPQTSRFYNPVRAVSGNFTAFFAIRGGGRRFCDGMDLTWDQADRLCDVFEDIRREAQREQAA